MAGPATPAMLLAALPLDLVLRLTDDDNDGTPDVAVVDELCDEVNGEIAGHVGRVYSVAIVFAAPPSPILAIARKLLVHAAYSRRVDFVREDGSLPSSAWWKEAQDTLKAIGASKFKLDVDGVPEAPAGNAGGGGGPISPITGCPPTRPFFSGGGGLF